MAWETLAWGSKSGNPWHVGDGVESRGMGVITRRASGNDGELGKREIGVMMYKTTEYRR